MLYFFVIFIGMVLLADSILFIVKRNVIEPRVKMKYPNLNCNWVMVGEMIIGLSLIIIPIVKMI